jgi:hypothetical protein
MANKFGEIQHSCWGKFSSFRVGETEWQICCDSPTFCLPRKLESLVKSTQEAIGF